MSLDFDAIRETLRGVITFAAAAGSVAVVSGIMINLGKLNGARTPLDFRALQRFVHTSFCVCIAPARTSTMMTSMQLLFRWYSSLSANDLQQLFWCIFLDTAGAAPELLLPGPVGESVDLMWAPVYASLLFQT